MEISQSHNANEKQEAEYKTIKDAMKAGIKKLVDVQIGIKGQRKKFDYPGEFSQSQAQSLHAINRVDLRHHYIAYALFRQDNGGYTKYDKVGGGKEFNIDYVRKIIASHGSKTVRLNQAGHTGS